MLHIGTYVVNTVIFNGNKFEHHFSKASGLWESTSALSIQSLNSCLNYPPKLETLSVFWEWEQELSGYLSQDKTRGLLGEITL